MVRTLRLSFKGTFYHITAKGIRKENIFSADINLFFCGSKTIDSYDFTYKPKLNKKEMPDLASCRFIQGHKNIIFMGNPGTGKTHLANAIGVEAIKMDYAMGLIKYQAS